MMFYTPGWGAILGIGGTLGGVAITQAANSLLSLRTSRKERHKAITDAVADLIAAGNAWVYAASAQEQDLFLAINMKVPQDEQMKMLKELRDNLYPAQLDFGRALAVVRLRCPEKVVSSAETYRTAIMDFEQESRDKGSLAIQTGTAANIPATLTDGIVSPQARLVEAVRAIAG
jgi:hypothetical protein